MSGGGHGPPSARLLPWVGDEGKPCYVVGEGTGRVSRLADGVESIQLGMAGDLLEHAAALLEERGASAGELRYLANRLTESLTDVKRVAESRGARLARTDPARDPYPAPAPDGGPSDRPRREASKRAQKNLK
ncbi:MULTISPECIES: hypothetical protein [Streptomyces]|uniref:hypothetical protein n=1 Tax=Streptomyces TaxID=1883 RepID=UPI00200C0909|nr:hypothetical protein [Streptomyces sp. LRE541]UPZ31094.1 hypothetical protein MUK60_26995 [Streptomyces sp. LRE541]